MSELANSVPFLDLTGQFEKLRDEWLECIRQTGASGAFILGPNVHEFEREFAAYLGVEHAVAVANGTDALMLSLRALGVGQGDEVITTPYTFFATAEVIDMVGATPVFTDIEADSFNIDPGLIEAAITARTKAILPVHLFGCAANMNDIRDIAARHGLRVVEDCAQAFGAEHDGRQVGSMGDTGCFSFYPTKVLGCYGDGGMVTTDDAQLAARLRHLRNHGASAPFVHDVIGCNSRLDEIQAALLRIKMRHIEADIQARRDRAKAYGTRLDNEQVILPDPVGGGHVFNLYTVRLADRDRVRQALTDAGIGTSVCYPVPLHLQQVYRHLGYAPGQLPVSERASEQCLSLPIFPDMSTGQVDRVCDVLLKALR